MKVKALALGIVAFLLLLIIENANATPYESLPEVQYEYYNWNDNPLSYEIIEYRGSDITQDIRVDADVGDWEFHGHTYHYRLVVTVKNNRTVEDIWPGTNTHYGFKIGIWDSETLKYIEDMRDSLYPYSNPGHYWYSSSVDGHFVPPYTSFIDIDYDYPNGKWEREYFRMGTDWYCVSQTASVPEPATLLLIGSGLAVLGLLGRKKVRR